MRARALLAALLRKLSTTPARAAIVAAKVGEEEDKPGYNAKTGEYGDLFEMGVIDPVKVTRNALQNAGSIAGLVLTTKHWSPTSPNSRAPTTAAWAAWAAWAWTACSEAQRRHLDAERVERHAMSEASDGRPCSS